MSLIDSFSEALFDSDLVATRMTLALSEMLWAIMLFWPGDTFSRPTYLMMSHVADEMAWAAAFAVTSVLQFSIVLMRDYRSRFARYFAAWNACLWVFVVASMLLSVYPPPAAVGGEIALAFAAAWIWIRPAILAEGYRRACQCKQR